MARMRSGFAQHFGGDVLGLEVEPEFANPLSDRDRRGAKPGLLRRTGSDEVLEHEFDGGKGAPAVGAAELVTESVERLRKEHLVALEQAKLLGQGERLRLRLTALSGALALDLVRSLGASPAFRGRKVMGRGGAVEPPSCEAAQGRERGIRLGRDV